MQLTRLALALVLLAGCGAPPALPPPSDTGPRDAAPRDSGAHDAAMDAPAEDGGDAATDDGGSLDAATDDADLDAGSDDAAFAPDAAIPDTGTDAAPFDANLDAGPCALPDGGFDLCACGTYGADCSVASCAAGTVCLADPCGMHCAPAGETCTDPSDCASGSACSTGTCTHAGGGCADSRDCPPGHSCDAGACRDRRVGCRPVEGFDCPWGFVCETSGIPFCLHTLRRCATDAACEADSRCRDIDGDGARECSGPGSCMSNADCTGGLVCGTRPALRVAACSRYGPCRTAADCSTGMLCRDLWGDGIHECVDAGGTCASQADCPGISICGTPTEGGPPTCLSTPLGS
jgi:hypothetical protein